MRVTRSNGMTASKFRESTVFLPAIPTEIASNCKDRMKRKACRTYSTSHVLFCTQIKIGYLVLAGKHGRGRLVTSITQSQDSNNGGGTVKWAVPPWEKAFGYG